MVGPNITLIGNKGKGITYSNYAQMISPNTVLNDDPYFTNTGSNGSACNTAATISEDAVSGISCTIDTGTVWTAGGATKSLKFTYTGASNYDVVTFDRFPVEAGDRLIANTAFYGGTSTGTDAVQLQFIYSYCNAGLATSTDGSAYGDSTSSLYTGARTSWGMMASLRQATVPVGVCYAQLSVTISQLASGDVFRLGAAVVNKE